MGTWRQGTDISTFPAQYLLPKTNTDSFLDLTSQLSVQGRWKIYFFHQPTKIYQSYQVDSCLHWYVSSHLFYLHFFSWLSDCLNIISADPIQNWSYVCEDLPLYTVKHKFVNNLEMPGARFQKIYCNCTIQNDCGNIKSILLHWAIEWYCILKETMHCPNWASDGDIYREDFHKGKKSWCCLFSQSKKQVPEHWAVQF